jgi:catechol 2,3-dioxygenase-like lactoylglutathione lyase family enzyme
MPTRREVVRVLAGAGLARGAFGQGRCRDGYATQGCPLTREVATAPIKPVFAPTGWKTVGLQSIVWEMPDYRKEAAFYIALMGWTLRSDDGKQAVLDIGDWGAAIFKQAPERKIAAVTSFCFAIEPWRDVAKELEKRGLNPVADGESFHVKDPDGFDLQIARPRRRLPAGEKRVAAKLDARAPFDATGWSTVWLDHFSYNASNYKATASFYTNLLGWKETYDEGTQNELLIGEVGDMIVRGVNPNDPNFGKPNPRGERPRIDHISFGISPWDTDGVKAELEKRGLRARIDTSTKDDIHVAAFKSYHTTTPNGYDLQISYVTHENRMALANAVRPK